jgi:hypothetical protein
MTGSELYLSSRGWGRPCALRPARRCAQRDALSAQDAAALAKRDERAGERALKRVPGSHFDRDL